MTSAELIAAIHGKFSDVQEIPKAQGQVRGDEAYISVPAGSLVEVCRYLRYDPPLSFDFLSFLTSIDWKDRYEIVYYMLSTVHKHKLIVKVTLSDRTQPSVPSISQIWAAADWQEREVFDLMGIRFDGHYNLRRILLPDDWEGYPLRKDYAPQADRYD